MKVIVFKRTGGGKTKIFAQKNKLSEGKKELSNLYMTAIENFPDEITDNDKLSKDCKHLRLFQSEYWIEKNQTL